MTPNFWKLSCAAHVGLPGHWGLRLNTRPPSRHMFWLGMNMMTVSKYFPSSFSGEYGLIDETIACTNVCNRGRSTNTGHTTDALKGLELESG